MATTEYYSDDGAPADGRTRHYGQFYGLDSSTVSDDRPVLLVWGNCQAEALRIVLSGAPDLPYRTVRVPPVHELTPSDMPFVDRLVDDAAVLVSQPIRAGYRELPIGTGELATRVRTTIVWPVVRYGGLFPFQAIVRHPSDPSAVPAGVPYHDLRTVVGLSRGRTRYSEWDIGEDRIRAAAAWSVDQLAERERTWCDVAISDVLLSYGVRAAHTVNHPGNDVLVELGTRILAELGCGAPSAPDRELLGSVRAPLEPPVLEALGLGADPCEEWIVDGNRIAAEEIHDIQVEWYRERPEFVTAAMVRYRELVDILGMRS